MKNAHIIAPKTKLDWQPDKMLQAGDRVWILTDVQSEWSSFYLWAQPQQLYRAGIYDLKTGRVGFARFGRDIAYAIVKAGVRVPPWRSPLDVAIEVERERHDGEPKGRFRTKVKRVELDESVTELLPLMLRMLATVELLPSSLTGMWNDFEERAASENAIERAALSMPGLFKTSNVKSVVGNDTRISRVLSRLVRERCLVREGRRYRVPGSD